MATEIIDTYYGRQLADIVVDLFGGEWMIAYTIESNGSRSGTSYMAHRILPQGVLAEKPEVVKAEQLQNN